MSREYNFRPYVQDDIPFILSSWSNSYFSGANYKKAVSPEGFNKYHRRIRENYLDRPTAAVIVCCATEDNNLILGWIAVEKPEEDEHLILHYIYVKDAFKGNGIAKELLTMAHVSDKIVYTHKTDRAEMIMKKKGLRGFYAPHLI